MKTFVFQLEVEMDDEQYISAAVQLVLRSMVDHLSTLKQAGEDPPFRLTAIPLGLKE